MMTGGSECGACSEGDRFGYCDLNRLQELLAVCTYGGANAALELAVNAQRELMGQMNTELEEASGYVASVSAPRHLIELAESLRKDEVALSAEYQAMEIADARDDLRALFLLGGENEKFFSALLAGVESTFGDALDRLGFLQARLLRIRRELEIARGMAFRARPGGDG